MLQTLCTYTQLRFRNNFNFFKHFNWIFPVFGIFLIKMHVSKQNMARIGSGMVGNMLRSNFLCLGHAAGAFFWPKTCFFEVSTWSFFEKVTFRQKLDFWVTYLERYLTKVVHMDHTDHLVFGQKSSGYGKSLPKKEFWGENQLFLISVKMN